MYSLFKIKKAQVSIEYMLIIAFTTLITVPLIIIYMTFSQESSDEIASTQIHQVAKTVVDAAESMYYLGEPSQTTLTVNIPDNIVLANLTASELIYKIRTKDGVSEIVTNAAVNISGTLPVNPGIYKITVVARSQYVEVSYS